MVEPVSNWPPFAGLTFRRLPLSAPQRILPLVTRRMRHNRDLSKGELHAADFAGRRLVVFLLGAASDKRIPGGTLAQDNGRPMR